ncbi:nuclear transport factor 2 family protein [Streptomyces sp. NPDC018057]|uniref:nuclear transport factor 2 family protein n=1 Tax=unclassified Streptomyces TaxID=2593676 RepID=UPI0037A1AE27
MNADRDLIQDRIDIVETLARYVRDVDDQEVEKVAELFTATGALQIHTRTGRRPYEKLCEAFVSREGLRELAKSWPRERVAMHRTSDHIVRIDGDGAELSARFIVVDLTDDRRIEGSGFSAYTVQLGGQYEATLQKADGEWRFTRLDIHISGPLG